MKKSILRLIGNTLLVATGIGLFITCIGLAIGWRTSTQFSNAFFWLGGILIVVGLLTILGGYGIRSDFGVVYSQSAGDMNVTERAQRWAADMTQGYGTFLFLFVTGGFLIGLSVLVGTIFK